MKWNYGQELALETIRAWQHTAEPWLSLTGPAGTGKTTILQALITELRDVVFTAMTGKAALRLREVLGIPAFTLHSQLYEPPKQDERKQELTFDRIATPTTHFVVIDEASMMSPQIFRDLAKWAEWGTKILLVGDSFQLPPVISQAEEREYGKDFTVFNVVKGPELTEVVRSDDGIVRAATFLRERHSIPLEDNDAYLLIRPGCRPRDYAVDAYMAAYLGNRDLTLITWRNRQRMDANRQIRNWLRREGLLQLDEPVLFCRNGQGVLNGELQTVQNMEAGPTLGPMDTMWVTGGNKTVLIHTVGNKEPMDGEFPRYSEDDFRQYKRAWRRQGHDFPTPAPATYGYVLTAHKAQGSEFDKVAVFLDRWELHNEHFKDNTTLPNGQQVPFRVRWLYTAMTRAKHHVSLVIE